MIICSFKEKKLKFTAPEGFDLSKGTLVLGNYHSNAITDNGFVTRPYEARVYLFEAE